MTALELTTENKNNLISLWLKTGKKIGAYKQGKSFDYCIVEDASWPNKLWFHTEPGEAALQEALVEIKKSPRVITVPYFEEESTALKEAFDRNGLKVRSQQVGMYLSLQDGFDPVNDVRLELAEGEKYAEVWADLFEEAFKYRIEPRCIQNDKQTQFYLISYDGRHVGTINLHADNEHIVGVHSMGIIPAARQKGLGIKVMISILNQAISENYRYVTLQASDMGLGLYEKLGFKRQFLMKNYQLLNQKT